MEAVMLICDHAAVAAGKLYINGGGWSQIQADVPATVGVAIKLEVPWDQANKKHKLSVYLITEDGVDVPGPDGNPIKAEGVVEVGRPPGLKSGTPLDVPMAINFAGITLAPGGYRWELKIGEEIVTTVSVVAMKGQQP